MRKNTVKIMGTSMLVLLLATGCGKVPKLENGQDAVLTLNGSSISVDTLYNEMKDKYALSVLIDLMDKEILNKEYETDKEMKEDINEEINMMIKMYGNGDEAKLLQQTASAWGVSTREQLTDYLALQLKREKAIEDYAKSIVKDDEIDKYYNDKIFGDISAKHILIAPDVASDATDSDKATAEAEALKLANEIITKLNNGEDFDTLAKEYSDDEGTKNNGGLLPDFVEGEMVSEFEEAAKKLEVGKYTATPVKSQYGYHIILKVSQKEKPSKDTVKEDIIKKIAKNNINNDSTLQLTALVELRKKYDVKIEDDSLNTQYENYIQNMKKQLKETN